MRTFIAIELDKEIKEKISLIEEELRKTDADVKWVKPENIHLTLKFLGEIDEKQADKIKNILQDLAKEKQTFEMAISELGAFPKLNFPRVIWIGIKKGAENVLNIASELEEKLSKIGFPKEKRSFSGHISIGRVRSNKNRLQLIEAVNKINEANQKETYTQLVKNITLFKSTLTPQGPIYEALFTANLKNT
jgi:2'-5' RNA ligase